MAADIEPITNSPAKVAVRLCNFVTARAELLQSHERWLDAAIAPVVKSFQNPYVNIIGYASRLGDAKANADLSRRRCESVKRRIATYSTKVIFPLEMGKGEAESGSVERDNDGYWRAVDVYVYGVRAPDPPLPPPLPNPETRLDVMEQIAKAHNMVRRAEWGKRTPDYKRMDKDWDYDSIVIHHSGNRGEKNPVDIEDMHMNDGHPDVDYHYLLHPGGTIYEGRKIIYKGEHVKNGNTRKIGLLMLGDFDEQVWDDDDDLTQKHLTTLRSLIKTLKRSFPTIKYLGGHKEFAAVLGDHRTCPGNLLLDKMGDLRSHFSLNAPEKP
jgi:hypothetical protein